MPSLERALERELETLLLGDEPEEELTGDVEELADYFGSTPREQNPAMAAALAGTDDKSSREYRNALRSVQRYRAGEGKQRRTASPLRLRIIVESRRRVSSVSAKVRGLIEVSSDKRRRGVPAGPAIPIDASDVIAAHNAGDTAGAADAFEAAFGAAYGVPLSILDVDELELEAGD